jgi:hypothetical protein
LWFGRFRLDLNKRFGIMIVSTVNVLVKAIFKSNKSRTMLQENIASGSIVEHLSHVKDMSLKRIKCHPFTWLENCIGIGLRRRYCGIVGTVLFPIMSHKCNDGCIR